MNIKNKLELLMSEKPKTKNKYRYSNYGFGLLGGLLSKQLGEKYSEALSKQIFKTFGMNNSGVGLGSCMIGSINPFLKFGGKQIKNKYRINSKLGEGIFVIFGYPKFSYKKSINRTFENVNIVSG